MISEVFDGIHKIGRMILAGITVYFTKEMAVELHQAGVSAESIVLLAGAVVSAPAAYILRKGKGYTPRTDQHGDGN